VFAHKFSCHDQFVRTALLFFEGIKGRDDLIYIFTLMQGAHINEIGMSIRKSIADACGIRYGLKGRPGRIVHHTDLSRVDLQNPKDFRPGELTHGEQVGGFPGILFYSVPVIPLVGKGEAVRQDQGRKVMEGDQAGHRGPGRHQHFRGIKDLDAVMPASMAKGPAPPPDQQGMAARRKLHSGFNIFPFRDQDAFPAVIKKDKLVFRMVPDHAPDDFPGMPSYTLEPVAEEEAGIDSDAHRAKITIAFDD